MPRTSGGILLYRRGQAGIEVLAGHMGGPFWARKHQRAWSLPKGEPLEGEEPAAAARREFEEELGLALPAGELVALGEVRQSGGKVVSVWALEGDLDPAAAVPGTFVLEWPPRSGILRDFPELDRIAWLPLDEARSLLVAGQVSFLDRLLGVLARQ